MHTISPAGQAATDISPDPNYRKTVLPSGLRVVTEEIPYVRSVSCGVWVNVGSRDENPETNGITHFIEHMLFKGSDRYSSQRIAHSLESVGGYLNAFTTKEHTCFYARVLDDHLARAVDVLSDLVQHPRFDPKEIEKERHVIMEELKNIEDDPDDLIHDYLDLNVYRNHPLGLPIVGNAENVGRFTRDELTSYHERQYLPGSMVIAAAGNLRHETVVRLAEKFFQPRSHTKRTHPREGSPRKGHSRKEVFEKSINQAHVCMGTLGYGVKSHFRYPLLVLNSLLGEGMSSRLFQNIREKYGFAYSVYSFANFMSDTGSFGVYIGTENEKIDISISLIEKELEKLKTKPVGASELKRTKAQLKGSLMLGLESMSSRMMRLGSGELYFGGYLSVDRVLKGIDAVGARDVSAIAQKLLRNEHFSTVIFKAHQTKSGPTSTS